MSGRAVDEPVSGRRMGRGREWLVALGLVVVASIAVATAPQQIADPFVRTGERGEVVHARTLDVEVSDVRAARELDVVYDESTLGTDGVWVIVDLIVSSNVASLDLGSTLLRIDGVSYGTRDLPYPDMTFLSYGAGVPVKGSLVFEVPASVLEGEALDAARVSFQAGVSVQLDDVPEVIVDLRDLDVASSETIDEPVVQAVR
jgi:hypothetical protein